MFDKDDEVTLVDMGWSPPEEKSKDKDLFKKLRKDRLESKFANRRIMLEPEEGKIAFSSVFDPGNKGHEEAYMNLLEGSGPLSWSKILKRRGFADDIVFYGPDCSAIILKKYIDDLQRLVVELVEMRRETDDEPKNFYDMLDLERVRIVADMHKSDTKSEHFTGYLNLLERIEEIMSTERLDRPYKGKNDE